MDNCYCMTHLINYIKDTFLSYRPFIQERDKSKGERLISLKQYIVFIKSHPICTINDFYGHKDLVLGYKTLTRCFRDYTGVTLGMYMRLTARLHSLHILHGLDEKK